MIPKIIHYCWFGRSPLPPLAEKCINSWKKYLPDYTIKEWNEDNFNVNIIPYTADAYKAKKFAFVSDYARFWILYHEGGIYFDIDVEVIKKIDDIVEKGPFMGCERFADKKYNDNVSAISVAPGLGIAALPHLPLFKQFIDLYKELDYAKERSEGRTIVHYTSQLLAKEGLKNTNEIQHVAGIYIYPKDYFCPINQTTNRIHITSNTRSIHHYAATWTDKEVSVIKKIKKILQPFIPEKILLFWHEIKCKRNKIKQK